MKPKFRYYDSVINHMVYSDEFDFDDYNERLMHFFAKAQVCAHNNLVMQAVGKKDMLGNEIYEHDIIEDNVGEFKTVVFYNDGRWVAGLGNFFNGVFCSCVISDSPTTTRRKKVIGNIYQNYDLLS